jgi:hypothetical protein
LLRTRHHGLDVPLDNFLFGLYSCQFCLLKLSLPINLLFHLCPQSIFLLLPLNLNHSFLVIGLLLLYSCLLLLEPSLFLQFLHIDCLCLLGSLRAGVTLGLDLLHFVVIVLEGVWVVLDWWWGWGWSV